MAFLGFSLPFFSSLLVIQDNDPYCLVLRIIHGVMIFSVTLRPRLLRHSSNGKGYVLWNETAFL